MMIGKPAPNFTLNDQHGRKVSLEEFKGKRNVLILFYPLDWTPV